MFEQCLLEKVKHVGGSEPTDSSMPLSLSADEKNALRYASGFVPYKLLKKYSKSSTESHEKYCGVLRDMSYVADINPASLGHDYTYETYTCEWLSLVDRGGLFKINEDAYRFFMAVEKVVRIALPGKLTGKQPEATNVASAAKKDFDVQHYWAILSSDLEDESDSSHLLHEIVSLWVTIRGFSLASAWLEKYKIAKDTCTKKKKGLRKSIAPARDS